MRLIGTINNEHDGIAFSLFLHQKGIHHRVEIAENLDWGSHDYGLKLCKIWIEDEDQVADAMRFYHLFIENPSDPIFAEAPKPFVTVVRPPKSATGSPTESSVKTAKTSITTLWEKQPMGPITRFFLSLCTLLFIVGSLIPPPTSSASGEVISTFFSSPFDKALLYDFPRFYELLDKFLQQYGFEGLKQPETLSKEGHDLYNIMTHTSYWEGFYDMTIKKGFSSLTNPNEYPPLFEKIRQGQVWRLFSPALLHANILHLFFNMLWLIVLGKQMEQRLKAFPYIFLILFLGVFSNTAQYLMSGPNFLGFSGILVGMLTFIWMRQRYAPWEGYLVDRTTFLFMAVYILGLASLQLISFITENTFDMAIAPNIANTAHLSGALGGLVLGRFNFFSWRKG